MPCIFYDQDSCSKEIELSRVCCLLDELNGVPIDPDKWQGFHPKIYNRLSKVNSDELVAELCSKLQKINVTEYSLEMQIWWRDHQKYDKERVEHELSEAKTRAEREIALAKLTEYEKKLLGY